ncbi:hypothetical protein CHS0354_009239 [Potamilus streckersoni]|uniref:Molluscan prismatic and nacreous layer 88 kDa protein n=1 Tax=Potamilus streckersoni TaxID=2493646 RepID=A0AAE0SJS9_9BIVA|nr:hypothetical protein CHS0354_009239 [Potamilus streckersoni]
MRISTILPVVLLAFVKISYGNHIETAMARSRAFGGGGGGLRGVGGFPGFGGGIPGRATIPGMPMPGDPSFARILGGGGGGGLGGTFGTTDGAFMDPMSGQPVQLVTTGVADQFRQARLSNGGGQTQSSQGLDPFTAFLGAGSTSGFSATGIAGAGLGLGGIFGAAPDAQFIDPTSGAPVQLAPTGVINTLRDARAGGFAGFGGQGGGVPTFSGAGIGGNIFQQQGIGGFPPGGAGGAGSFTPGTAGGDQFQPITIRISADRSRGPTLTRGGFTEQLVPGTTLADLGLGGAFGASAGSFGQSGAGQQGFESFGQQALGTRAGGQGSSQIFSGQSLQIPSGTQGFQQGAASLGSQAPGGFDSAFAGFGAQNQFGGGQPQTGAGFQGQFGAGTAASFGQQAGQPSGQQFGGLTFTQLGGSQSSQGGASSSIFPMEFSQFQDLPGGAGGQFQSSFDAPFQTSGASSSGFGAFGEQGGTSLPGVSLTASNPGLGQFSQSSPQGGDLTGFTGLSQSGTNPFSQGSTSGGQFGGTSHSSSGGSTSTFSGQGMFF